MKKVLLILIIMPLFFLSCHADNAAQSALEISGVDRLEENLPGRIRKISGEIKNDGTYDSGGALKRLGTEIIESVDREIKANIQSLFSLIIISLLCAVCGILCADKKTADYINIAGVCAVAALFLNSVDGMVEQTVTALGQINTYSRAAFPAVFAAAAAGGAITAASARYAAVSLGLDVIMNIAQNTVIPLMYCYLAFALCRGLFENPMIKALQHFVKWLNGLVMSGVILAFSAYMSIVGAVSSSADALAVKTARTVISNFLPVVGGMISDAASTVLSAANMIKTSAGAFSLVAVAALCAGPFVMLSVKMLVFRVAAAGCNMLPCGKVSGFVDDIGTALSILLGLLGSVSIMLFISFMSVIKAVAG